MLRLRHLLIAAVLVAGSPELAEAQCPDGSPPPCRSRTVATAPRRVNPPLDDRTWIVVPFDNLAKAEDIDWLRNAAVNLLYLDMSRWRDIRVVDDERVADLVREVPDANTASLSLNAGLAVARRAGAGKLVMGDLLRIGNRTAVTAKIYDVRNGQRLRSVREETAIQDSVMPMFGKLARRILNLAPPGGAQVGAHGTSRVDAYQEYVAGLEAMNRFDLTAARARLEKAVALDSAFALAHFKLATVIGWIDPGLPERRRHAETSARLQAGLPPRERALITGMLLQTTGDWTASCEQYEGLLAKDSADVEAWYGLGECMYHNLDVAPIAGDTTRMRFLGDWNRSIDAFQKVLELDPSYHLAYAHIVDILTSERHTQGCYRPNTSTRCVQLWGSYLLRDGDSLLVAPLHFQRDTAALRMQVERYTLTQSRRRNLQEADAMATAWVRASPSEQRALRELAHVRLLQGRARSADSIYAALTERSSTWLEELRSGLDGMEISYKLGRGLEAAARYDSIRASTTMIPNPQGPIPFGSAVAGYGPAFGRLAEFDSVLATNMRASNAPQFVIDYQLLQYRALVGVPGDSVIAMERVVFDTVRALRGASIATRNISGMLAYGLRVPRSAWPALDTSLKEPRLQPAIAMSRKDTARLRRSLRALDSIISAHAAAGGADSGYAVPAADGYLILGDSAAALRTLRVALDSLLPTTGLFLTNQGGLSPVMFVPRMMLLRADLAAARGSPDEARHWYKRFIEVWAQASPELQPAVERARKAYTALGGS